jgi:hypothetical protein
MLLLARIDGKSPVEYLGDGDKREFVRQFVSAALPDFRGDLQEAGARWWAQLARRFGSS